MIACPTNHCTRRREDASVSMDRQWRGASEFQRWLIHMRIPSAILLALLFPCLARGFADQPQVDDMRKNVLGTWLAAETMMPRPPPEMQQDLKEIAFSAGGVVEWTVAKDGEAIKRQGRYLIQKGEKSSRNLPELFVAPSSYTNPAVSSICLLRLTELEIDLDSRFNTEKIG